MTTDTGKPGKSFGEARQEIAGDSWLDDLARQSLIAAEIKFDTDQPSVQGGGTGLGWNGDEEP